MRTIFHVNLDDDGDVFFDEAGEMLASWYANDANYRAEYMKPLFTRLGIDVQSATAQDPRFNAQIVELLKGYGHCDEDIAYITRVEE